MASKNKASGWMLLYIFAGGMDFIQFVVIELILVWFFGIGIAINEVLDPIVGIIIAAWIQFGKKVSLISRPSRLLSMVGTEAAAAFTGGIAQLWILDVWYIHRDVKKETAEQQAAEEQQEFMQNDTPQRYYENGVGRTRGEEQRPNQTEFNRGGYSRARGNLSSPKSPSLGETPENSETSLAA